MSTPPRLFLLLIGVRHTLQQQQKWSSVRPSCARISEAIASNYHLPATTTTIESKSSATSTKYNDFDRDEQPSLVTPLESNDSDASIADHVAVNARSVPITDITALTHIRSLFDRGTRNHSVHTLMGCEQLEDVPVLNCQVSYNSGNDFVEEETSFHLYACTPKSYGHISTVEPKSRTSMTLPTGRASTPPVQVAVNVIRPREVQDVTSAHPQANDPVPPKILSWRHRPR
jgi:hypothetical protein